MANATFSSTIHTVFAQLEEAVRWLNLVPKDYNWRPDTDIDTGWGAIVQRGPWVIRFEEHGELESGDDGLSFTLGLAADPEKCLEIKAYVLSEYSKGGSNAEAIRNDSVWLFERTESPELEAVLKSAAPELLPFTEGRFAGSESEKPHELVANIMVRLITWLETLPTTEV